MNVRSNSRPSSPPEVSVKTKTRGNFFCHFRQAAFCKEDVRALNYPNQDACESCMAAVVTSTCDVFLCRTLQGSKK